MEWNGSCLPYKLGPAFDDFQQQFFSIKQNNNKNPSKSYFSGTKYNIKIKLICCLLLCHH